MQAIGTAQSSPKGKTNHTALIEGGFSVTALENVLDLFTTVSSLLFCIVRATVS